ncbi:MAG TPA: aminoglycoside phosphotransferase family protein [Candidatus Krumholzibacteria bacterium]
MTEPLRTTLPGDTGARIDEHTLRVVAGRLAERARDYGLVMDRRGTVSLRPYRETSSYPLYLAEIASGTGALQRVVVKFAPIFGTHREGQAEFTNLRAMSARLESRGQLHVPRPLDYWEDVNALVTEHRPGMRFSARILSTPGWFSSRRTRHSLACTARQCGEWLRIYHDTTARGRGPALDERFMNIMRRDIARIPPRGSMHGLRPRIVAALETIQATLATATAPVSVRHGDFSPDNVHLDGDGICVFDLSHHASAPVHDDITFFLVTLDTMNPYPRYPAFDRRTARALASPFLDGYFGADRARRESEESAVLGAYTLKNLLTRCLRQRRVAAAAGPLALAAFDGLWVAGRYRDLVGRAIERATAAR